MRAFLGVLEAVSLVITVAAVLRSYFCAGLLPWLHLPHRLMVQTLRTAEENLRLFHCRDSDLGIR